MNRYRLYSRKTGYDDTYNKRIDASVCNGFAAAPFRFGHSQIMPHQTLLHDDYTTRNVTLLENNYNFPKLILEDQGANCPNFARWLVYTFSMKINKWIRLDRRCPTLYVLTSSMMHESVICRPISV